MPELRKITARAPSNLAFVKYWGRKDEVLAIPTNGSVSVALDGMHSTTTVEFSDAQKEDSMVLNGKALSGFALERVTEQLDRIRNMAKIQLKARVVSTNSFPTGTGLSTSASGFAALTLAGTKAAGLELSEKELSIFARQSSSGSACRSIPAGFCEWYDGTTSETSFAESFLPPEHWDLSFLAAVVSSKPKHLPSTIGHRGAQTSPFFETRDSLMPNRIKKVKKYLKEKDFALLGEAMEAEALELHAIMLTQKPALIYWSAGTVALMQMCQKWREDGVIEAYFSVNTGQDIYFMVRRKDEELLKTILQKTGMVKELILNHPGMGARIINKHLF